jgi:hypothetical protein
VARRRPYRSAVENDPELPVPAFDADLLIEAPPQIRTHGTARRLGRIERLVGENLLKHLTHDTNMVPGWRSFNAADHATTLPTLLRPKVSRMIA